MRMKIGSRITVFILSFLVWMLITSFTDRQELITGAAASCLVAVLAGDLLAPRRVKLGLKRIYHSLIYLIVLIWEIFKANVHVAYIVLHPRLPIKPGIVKIKTGLTSEAALTILANSITLTPGTFTMDLNQEKGEIYVHCLIVPSLNMEENSASIGGKFENRLKEIFQ
ncbi:MAG: Na+/H+ antiporter subunit E [Bacillota bacterium]